MAENKFSVHGHACGWPSAGSYCDNAPDIQTVIVGMVVEACLGKGAREPSQQHVRTAEPLALHMGSDINFEGARASLRRRKACQQGPRRLYEGGLHRGAHGAALPRGQSARGDVRGGRRLGQAA